MSATATVRAALYLRMSRDREGLSLGVDRQRPACAKVAKGNGWEVAAEFVDNDVSATSGRRRPAYEAMLQAVRDGELDAIVCWHPDRLYRVLPDLTELVEVCKARGTQIATVNAGHIDLTTPSGRMQAGILAQVATYEGEHKAERWQASLQQARDAGKPFTGGSRLFGYTRDGEQVQAEVQLIRRAAEELLQGRAVRAIAADWNGMGVTTTRGKPWATSAVKTLLRNPRLAGFITLRGEVVGKVAPGTWAPVLDEDAHRDIVALLDSRSATTYTPRKAPLLGLLYCKECGARMESATRSGKGNDHARTYRCPQAGTGRGKGCTAITAEPLEAMVTGYARERLQDPRIGQEIATRAAGGSARAKLLREELNGLYGRRQELQDALAAPGAPVTTLINAMGAVDAAVAEAERHLAAILPTVSPVQLDVRAAWPTTASEQRKLLGVVVARVEVARATNAGRFDAERVTITPAETVA